VSIELKDLTFVVNCNNRSLFERNFVASPCLAGIRSEQVILQEKFASASLAYNDGIEKAKTDLIVFAHQDVYFPEDWLASLNRSLDELDRTDPNWGVLGGWGVDNKGLQAGFLYSVGLGILGAPFDRPAAIDTLDEYFLILRKSSGLRFDSGLPGFHFYGTDICMSARKKGKRSYAICAFAVHNTSYSPLPADFYEYYWDIKKKWREFLPIQTPCIRITEWNEDLLVRKFKHFCFQMMGRDLRPRPRLENPVSAMQSVTAPADKVAV
jgi:hypothetical protein